MTEVRANRLFRIHSIGWVVIFTPVCLLLTLGSCKKNKDAREPTIVFGQITDHLTGEPLEGVVITWGYLDNLANPVEIDSGMTDEKGCFDLSFGEDMLYQNENTWWYVWIKKSGYQKVSNRVGVGDVTELKYELYPE